MLHIKKYNNMVKELYILVKLYKYYVYEQGKMEHLMPTESRKHIVEDISFEIWDNPYFSLNEPEQMTIGEYSSCNY